MEQPAVADPHEPPFLDEHIPESASPSPPGSECQDVAADRADRVRPPGSAPSIRSAVAAIGLATVPPGARRAPHGRPRSTDAPPRSPARRAGRGTASRGISARRASARSASRVIPNRSGSRPVEARRGRCRRSCALAPGVAVEEQPRARGHGLARGLERGERARRPRPRDSPSSAASAARASGRPALRDALERERSSSRRVARRRARRAARPRAPAGERRRTTPPPTVSTGAGRRRMNRSPGSSTASAPSTDSASSRRLRLPATRAGAPRARTSPDGSAPARRAAAPRGRRARTHARPRCAASSRAPRVTVRVAPRGASSQSSPCRFTATRAARRAPRPRASRWTCRPRTARGAPPGRISTSSPSRSVPETSVPVTTVPKPVQHERPVDREARALPRAGAAGTVEERDSSARSRSSPSPVRDETGTSGALREERAARRARAISSATTSRSSGVDQVGLGQHDDARAGCRAGEQMARCSRVCGLHAVVRRHDEQHRVDAPRRRRPCGARSARGPARRRSETSPPGRQPRESAKPRSIVMPRRFSSWRRSGSVPVSAWTSALLPWSMCPAVPTTRWRNSVLLASRRGG